MMSPDAENTKNTPTPKSPFSDVFSASPAGPRGFLSGAKAFSERRTDMALEYARSGPRPMDRDVMRRYFTEKGVERYWRHLYGEFEESSSRIRRNNDPRETLWEHVRYINRCAGDVYSASISGIFAHKMKKLFRLRSALDEELLFNYRLFAFEKEKEEHIVALLKGGANPNAAFRDGSTGVHWILLRLLILAGKSPETIAKQVLRILDAFLDAGYDINARNESGDTAALLASMLAGEYSTVLLEAVLKRGGNALAVDSDGNSCMTNTCRFQTSHVTPKMLSNVAEACRILVENGANPNTVNANGDDILSVLLSYFIDIPPADDPSEWLEAFERFLSVLRDGGYDFGANAERALEKTVVRLYGQLNAAFLTAFGAPAEYTVSAVAKAMASKKGPDTWSPTRNPEIFWKEYLSKMRSLTENGMVSTSSAVELYQKNGEYPRLQSWDESV